MDKRADERLLRGGEGFFTDIQRSWQIASEFRRGFAALRKIGPCITFFGSSRFAEDNNWYTSARSAAATAGQRGFAIMTGGGPGIMEAANRGARDVGAHSIGCNIQLPREQQANPYLDTALHFDHFFVRKVMLVRYSSAFIILPGGFGTLDEVFETVTLIQTGKIRKFPVILMGSEYWSELIDFVRDSMLAAATINRQDLDSLVICDDPVAAIDLIQRGLNSQ